MQTKTFYLLCIVVFMVPGIYCQVNILDSIVNLKCKICEKVNSCCVGTFVSPSVILTTEFCGRSCHAAIIDGNEEYIQTKHIHPHFKNYIKRGYFMLRDDIALLEMNSATAKTPIEFSALDMKSVLGFRAVIPLIKTRKYSSVVLVACSDGIYPTELVGYHVCTSAYYFKDKTPGVCMKTQGVPLLLNGKIFGVLGHVDEKTCIYRKSFIATSPAISWISLILKDILVNYDKTNASVNRMKTNIVTTAKVKTQDKLGLIRNTTKKDVVKIFQMIHHNSKPELTTEMVSEVVGNYTELLQPTSTVKYPLTKSLNIATKVMKKVLRTKVKMVAHSNKLNSKHENGTANNNLLQSITSAIKSNKSTDNLNLLNLPYHQLLNTLSIQRGNAFHKETHFNDLTTINLDNTIEEDVEYVQIYSDMDNQDIETKFNYPKGMRGPSKMLNGLTHSKKPYPENLIDQKDIERTADLSVYNIISTEPESKANYEWAKIEPEKLNVSPENNIEVKETTTLDHNTEVSKDTTTTQSSRSPISSSPTTPTNLVQGESWRESSKVSTVTIKALRDGNSDVMDWFKQIKKKINNNKAMVFVLSTTIRSTTTKSLHGFNPKEDNFLDLTRRKNKDFQIMLM